MVNVLITIKGSACLSNVSFFLLS